jgi:hypothetical protein
LLHGEKNPDAIIVEQHENQATAGDVLPSPLQNSAVSSTKTLDQFRREQIGAALFGGGR